MATKAQQEAYLKALVSQVLEGKKLSVAANKAAIAAKGASPKK